MGAYLYYKTNSDVNEVQNYLLEKNEINMKLMDDFNEQGIFVTCSKDDHFNEYSTGNIKTSVGTISEKFEEAGYDTEDLLEMWTMIFEELNKRFKMKYFANSCAFSEEEYYFSLEQMKRITQNGKLLSGKTSKSERARELYDKYYKLFSKPEKEPFDISILKRRDTLLLDDGIYYTVGNWNSITVEIPAYREKAVYHRKKTHHIAEKIKKYKKFVPTVRYGGAVADMEAYILDKGELLYLELIGQESKVKSITSVLMQGRVKMNDITIQSTEFNFFSVNKAGNKRKIMNLEDGIAHAIVYHSPSIVDTNFSILIGRDKEELTNAFSAWLENSQPLPYPKEHIENIFYKLQSKKKLEELTSYGVEALKVNLSILEDEFSVLKETILEVCKENGLINPDAKPIKEEFPLPKSPILQERQVKKIWDTLNSMPKTYELEDVEIKPIGLKLFSSYFTLYITEADVGSEDDEYKNMHSQCYGYIKNETEPSFSEWGYIDVAKYIKLGNGLSYFEQDLYFENMYIDSNGNVDEFKEAA